MSTSSNVTLAWHTETAFHPHKPRYLLLLCLRGDRRRATMLCSVAHVPPAPRRGDDRDPAPSRGSAPGPTNRSSNRVPPVRSARRWRSSPATGEQPTFTYDEDLMVGIDAGAASRTRPARRRRARPRVVDRARSRRPARRRQRAASCTAARRSAARFDGTDRWLQRAFVVADLAPSCRGTRRPHHHDRVSDPARLDADADAGSEQLRDRVDPEAGECADDRPVDADELQVGPEQQLEPPRGLVGVPPRDRAADE